MSVEKNISRSRSYSGFFIVLEGIDGAGKTSVAKKLVDFLNEKGYEAVYTYEPYDTKYVEALKKHYSEYRDAFLDALTYAADRIVHVKSFVIPYLQKGYIIVCDRYYYSSAAYQAAQGAPLEWVLEINKFVPEPDLAIYLDVDPETGISRRMGKETRFPEYEKLDFLVKVRENYLLMVRKGLLKMIDANRNFEQVYLDVEKLVFEYLP